MAQFFDAAGKAAIHHAAELGDLEALEAELSKGVSVDLPTTGTFKFTPLMLAARRAQVEAVRLLLEQMANADATDIWGSTALHMCLHDRHECAQLLLDAKADVDKQTRAGSSALMHAARHSNSDLAKLLLQRRADTSLRDWNSQTAIDLAHDSLKHLFVPVPDAPPAPFPKRL